MSKFISMTVATDLCTYRIRRKLAGLLAAVALAVGLSYSTALADDKPAKGDAPTAAVEPSDKTDAADANVMRNGIRLGDEIVVVNTRSVCGCGNGELLRKGIKFENYAVCDEVGNRRWQSSNLDSFLAFDASVPTIFFIHGNQITPGDAKNEGLSVYRKMILQDPHAPRIRFAVFSWPSSRVGGLLRDVREKAARTEPAGYHLAWLLNQMPADAPVSLIGFSFGARIITGGLHVLAGGSLGGSLSLGERANTHRAPVNAVLMAAANHSYWLAEGQHHGRAMSQVDRMLLINNCQDRAMRYYDMLVPGRGGPQAMGLRGPTRISSKDSGKIYNRDVSRYVGSSHELMDYICAPGDAGLIWNYAGPAAEHDTKVGG
jgi:hypothetical protein